ncbi:MAG TPA: dynamin family protein [Acidimicrobiales bacterium]|nr:dynamin family protein [Acidimicrobiales bacterium]
MTTELDDLKAWARQLSELAPGRHEGEQARELVDRLASHEFRVMVVGEFKRGKSTLVNALLGESVVPTGVLPLTSVTTEIAYGESDAVVERLDGTEERLEPTEVDLYVTEEKNPGNQLKVARVRVTGRWTLLAPGVVLVDTPGVGSLYRHNTEAARATLVEADGAVVVLSADSPLSEQERGLLATLAERRAATFFVLNKADHLSAEDVGTVRGFVRSALAEQLGREVHVYAINSRAALEARKASQSIGFDAIEFADFLEEIERFIADDLVRARAAAATHELVRLGTSLGQSLEVEEAALQLDRATLHRRAALFAEEGSRQRRGFDEDRVLLGRDIARLIDEVAARVNAFAHAAPQRQVKRLSVVAESASRHQVTERLRTEVEASVRDCFEQFRSREAGRLELAWQEISARFRDRTQQRLASVRDAASDLFMVPLPSVDLPPVAAQRERFFYLFVRTGSSGEMYGHWLGRLVPGALARRRALRRARADLGREFDKHAGRVRWDLAQRLDQARAHLETEMGGELDRSIEAIAEAANRAELLGTAKEDEWRVRAIEASRQRELVSALCALDDDS